MTFKSKHTLFLTAAVVLSAAGLAMAQTTLPASRRATRTTTRRDNHGKQGPARTDLYGDPLPPGAAARLGTHRLRHTARVNSVAFSGDGKTIASAGEDGLVLIWDAATGKRLHKLVGHSRTGAEVVAFSPKGDLLASGCEGGKVFVWDTKTWAKRASFRHKEVPGYTREIWGLAFCPDGKTVAVRQGGKIHIWDIANGTKIREIAAPYVGTVVFSPDGRTIAAGYCIKNRNEHWVGTWETTTGKQIRRLDASPYPRSVAFTPDGRRLVAGCEGETVHVWDVRTGKRVRDIRTAKGLGLSVSPDSKRVAKGDSPTSSIWRRVRNSCAAKAPPKALRP